MSIMFKLKPYVSDTHFIERFERMAHEQALQMVDNVVRQLQQVYIMAEGAIENNGKLDVDEIPGIIGLATNLAFTIIGDVKRAKAAHLQDDLKFVAQNGRFVLPE